MPSEVTFVNTITQPMTQTSNESQRKEITMIEGISQIKWTEEEVTRMNQIEDLQFAVIGKFTMEWSNWEELKKLIRQ